MAIVVAMKSWPKGLRINICGGFGVFMGVLQTDRNFEGAIFDAFPFLF